METEYEQNKERERINRKVFLATHPEYHLYRDLQERLPKYVRIISKISKKNFDLPLNEKGLPF